MNTAEVLGAELSGVIVLLGLGIGYPWLWLHYAKDGVLKLGRPPQPRQAMAPESTAAAGETPAAAADPAQQIRPAA